MVVLFGSQSFAFDHNHTLDESLVRTHTVKPEFCDIYDGQENRVSLNGVWKFKPVINLLEKSNGQIVCKGKNPQNPETDEGLVKKFYRTEYDDSSWGDMMVPWVWNNPIPFKSTQKEPFAGLGYYRKHFEIPKSQDGKRVFITFDAVQSECKVWVNGILVGEHKNERSSTGEWSGTYDEYVFLEHFTLDITEAVKFGGDNVVTVRVYDDGLPIVSGAWVDDGGITSPVTIEYRPEVYCNDILLATDTQTGTITLTLDVINKLKTAFNSEITAEISTYNAKYYRAPVQQKLQSHKLGHIKLSAGADETFGFSFKMNDPVFWSPDRPQLYMLRLTDSQGNVIGYTRFGFRTFTVRDGKFYLNGKPIYLFGCNPDAGPWNQTFRILAYNHSNYLRYALMLFKDLNINYVRNHKGPASKQFFQLCDEIGLLVSVDFSPDEKMLELSEANRIEHLADYSVSQYLQDNGDFTDQFKKVLRTFIRFTHNNPSVVSFNAGNELGYKNQISDDTVRYFDNFYKFVKSEDLQKRPLTPSAGLITWEWNRKLKADFYDYHDYPVGRHGWADILPETMVCYNGLVNIFGHDQMNKPIVNGETLFLIRDMDTPNSTEKLFPDGTLDVAQYVQWANDIRKYKNSKNYREFVWQHWNVRCRGIRSLRSRDTRAKSSADILEEVVRVFRRDVDFLDGIAIHNIVPARYGMYYKYESGVTPQQVEQDYIKAKDHPEFIALQRAYSRLYAATDMYDRNCFAGKSLKTKLFIINNIYGKTLKNIVANVSVANDNGVISEQNIRVPKIKEYQKSSFNLNLPIPAKTPTGQYDVHILLSHDGKALFESSTGLFVLNRNDLKPIPSSQATALYDPAGKVPAILTSLRIPFDRIKKFDNLRKYKVLILGPSCFGPDIIQHASDIESWVRNGGTLLCFAQDRKGPIPFHKALSIEPTGNVLHADVIRTDHPFVSGMQPANWDVWNGKRERVKNGALSAEKKKIFDHYITPVTEGVVVSGVKRNGQWYTNVGIGMVVADVRIGKGRIILSQALACKRFNADSSATLFLYNILNDVCNKNLKQTSDH